MQRWRQGAAWAGISKAPVQRRTCMATRNATVKGASSPARMQALQSSRYSSASWHLRGMVLLALLSKPNCMSHDALRQATGLSSPWPGYRKPGHRLKAPKCPSGQRISLSGDTCASRTHTTTGMRLLAALRTTHLPAACMCPRPFQAMTSRACAVILRPSASSDQLKDRAAPVTTTGVRS